MTRDNRRKPNRDKEVQPRYPRRSPALEAIEQREASQRQAARRNSTRSARYAADDALSGLDFNATGAKRLPPLRFTSKASITQVEGERLHSGVTAGWRKHAPEKQEQPQPAAAAAQGLSEEETNRLAELEMCMPRVAGKIDSWLLIVVLVLSCIGVVMVYSASSFVAARDEGDAAYYFQRELIWLALGLIAMLVTMRIDYRVWRRYSLVGLIVVLPMLIIVLKFGTTIYGASRWISLGSFFSFQPSELTKLVLALYIADWLARKGRQVSTFLYGLAPFVILVGFILGLVLLENDLGTAIIIAGFATVMFFTAGANIVQFLLAMVCGSSFFLLEAFKGYRYYRLLGFLNPFKDITGINLQLYQALLAFGSGGWFGLGLGASRQKTGYLPFPFSDSIFPIIGEELGFIACALIVILYLFLAFRGFRLARRSRDIYGALLATGITTWLVLQAMINIGANTGTVPYTGVPLPFISFGGSSLVVSLAAIGVLLNISRYIQEPTSPALSRQTLSFRKKRTITT
ncbi:MAG TPA: putative lipid II flippase FtsW [Ktedonobacteraceae bacterium]|nr:putative lipid II flippase FtsW [Ktedonobacteraceae bacterium]